MDELFNKLIKNNLSPNQFYFLYCKKNNLVPQLINTNIEVARLQGEWITEESNMLTSKAIMLIKELDKYFISSKKKTSGKLMGDNYADYIAKYSEIFPKFMLPSGKYARSDKRNVENAFRWFFDNYSYPWSTIIGATELYVETFERQGYKYMRTSQYFIRKQNPIEKTFDSELADYCSIYENGGDAHQPNHFSEKVV